MPTPKNTSKFALLLAMVVIAFMPGCVPWARGIRTIDESVTDWRDFVWGKRAFYQRYGHDQTGPFMDGFLEGYHDMLQGGDGCPPVVPPRRYWSWKYQSAGGQGAVSDWFNGYSAGVAAAKEDGLSNLCRIPVSSQYNGSSSVPIQGMHGTEEEWIPFEEQLQPHSIPIPPSIEPTTENKGATFYQRSDQKRSATKSGVVKAAQETPLPTVMPLGNGLIEISPLKRISTIDRTESKRNNTPLGTSSAGRLPPIVPSTYPKNERPLPVIR